VPSLSQTQVSKVAALAALVDTAPAGPWDGALAGLFVNNVTPSPNAVTGDFIEPAWTGYAQLPITWNTPYGSASGSGEVVGNSVFFLSGSDASETVYGYFIVNATGDLLWAQLADTPLPIAGVAGITVLPLYRLT
jgi:hypothetical protein